MSNSDGRINVPRSAPIAVDQCGAGLATDIVSDRWTFLIIREAFYGVSRYDDIRADIGIPRSVLTDRLKKLVAAEILVRQPYREEGARTRFGYSLTEKGRDLGLMIIALMQWGDTHLKNGDAALALRDRHSGNALKVALVEADVQTTPWTDVKIKVLKESPKPSHTGE